MQNDFEEQLRQWRMLELEALNAEARLKGVQLGNTPEAASAARDAADKRKRADDFLESILGITRGKSPD